MSSNWGSMRELISVIYYTAETHNICKSSRSEDEKLKRSDTDRHQRPCDSHDLVTAKTLDDCPRAPAQDDDCQCL